MAIQTSKGPRYCPVAWATNGRIRADVVMFKGKPERHTEGAYYLEWREGAKRVRISVGKDAVDADNRRKRKAAELNAVNEGAALVPVAGPRSLVALVAEYLEETKLTKKPKTLAAYGTALRYFLESCHKLNVEDVDRKDLLKFCAFLRDAKDQSPRSVYNKFENLMSFLKAQGVRGLMGKNDWPRFTEEEPEVYEDAELDKLFAGTDAGEKLWYEFFLMTGEREQEVMYTYWTDVNFAAGTVRVSHKPDRGWTPKAYKGARDSHTLAARKQLDGVEDEIKQEL
jgi:integrase/recombinase XerD